MRTILCFLLLVSFFSLEAQQEKLINYKRVKVHLNDTFNIVRLASLGIEVEHGDYQKHTYFISDFSDMEIAIIDSAGFKMTTLIADVVEYYFNQFASIDNNKYETGCLDAPEYAYEKPENFKLGSMMGYYTYQEMLNELDKMASRFPNIISVKKPIGDFKTYDNNPIYWVKISDSLDIENDNEPQILYTALHHAREPISLSQLIYYMWYLLEHYEQDENIKYLIDHTAMYFIPCINPDGYVYNERTSPAGGGLWRKNKRDNNGNNKFDGIGDGVDLNRNYGFKWGYNNIGSSPSPSSETFRGPSNFSEPETQAVQFFCEAHQFKLALNYHAFSNLLIYPWGYIDELTENGEHFVRIGNALTQENQFIKGTAIQTVGYNVNGVSDDWMYQRTPQKPNAIFAMTPEVGPAYWGFWPPMNAIEFLCQSTLQKNLLAAQMVHPYPLHKEMTGRWVNDTLNVLRLNISNIGLDSGYFYTTIRDINNIVHVPDTLLPYFLAPLAEKIFNLPIRYSSSLISDTLLFEVATSNGIFSKLDTIVKIYKPVSEIFKETFDNQEDWMSSSTWGITDDIYYSPNNSLTDSPSGNYASNQTAVITLNDDILLDNANLSQVSIQYKAKWALEPKYDNVSIQISFNGIEYIPICGKYSVAGNIFPVIGEPVYNGFQPDWVSEDIDITDLVMAYGDLSDDNLKLKIRLQLTTDSDQVYDGFYLDDLTVRTSSNIISSVYKKDNTPSPYLLFPNPATQEVTLKLNGSYQNVMLNIYDYLGNSVIKGYKIDSDTPNIDLTNLSSGLYLVECIFDNKIAGFQKLVVIK